MNQKIGLLFDMDGVIAHTNPHHKIVIKDFCKKYNIDVTDEFLEKKVYGRTNKEWIPEVFGDIPDNKIESLADEKELLFREQYRPDLKPVDGLLPFLEAMQAADVPMVVGTSAPYENADFILSGLHINDYFSAILSSADVTIGKPHPDIYLKAAKAINLEAGNCVVLEDSLAGVQAGKAAGAKVIGITTTHSEKELSDCDLVISDFKNLRYSDIKALF